MIIANKIEHEQKKTNLGNMFWFFLILIQFSEGILLSLLLCNLLNRYILVMNFQSSKMWFLKGPLQLGNQICHNSHFFDSIEHLRSYMLACNG
jgi:hypothetical protein